MKKLALADNFENIIDHHDNANANTSSSTKLELKVFEFQTNQLRPGPDVLCRLTVHRIIAERAEVLRFI